MLEFLVYAKENIGLKKLCVVCPWNFAYFNTYMHIYIGSSELSSELSLRTNMYTHYVLYARILSETWVVFDVFITIHLIVFFDNKP